MIIKIRIANENNIDKITKAHIDSWRSTYKEILSNEYLNNLSYEYLMITPLQNLMIKLKILAGEL